MTLVRVSMGWAALGGWPASIFLTPGGLLEGDSPSEFEKTEMTCIGIYILY